MKTVVGGGGLCFICTNLPLSVFSQLSPESLLICPRSRAVGAGRGRVAGASLTSREAELKAERTQPCPRRQGGRQTGGGDVSAEFGQ